MLYNQIHKHKEVIEMELTKKLKIAMLELDITQVELAERTNQSQANLSRKIRGKNISFNEYEKLVEGLGCKLEINIVLPDGRRI